MENGRHEEHNNATETRCAKLYQQAQDGRWEDQGIGNVTVRYNEVSKDFDLVVTAKVDNKTLLLHRILRNNIYRTQEGDTTISWRDLERSSELALSFQGHADCSYIWRCICHARTNSRVWYSQS